MACRAGRGSNGGADACYEELVMAINARRVREGAKFEWPVGGVFVKNPLTVKHVVSAKDEENLGRIKAVGVRAQEVLRYSIFCRVCWALPAELRILVWQELDDELKLILARLAPGLFWYGPLLSPDESGELAVHVQREVSFLRVGDRLKMLGGMAVRLLEAMHGIGGLWGEGRVVTDRALKLLGWENQELAVTFEDVSEPSGAEEVVEVAGDGDAAAVDLFRDRCDHSMRILTGAKVERGESLKGERLKEKLGGFLALRDELGEEAGFGFTDWHWTAERILYRGAEFLEAVDVGRLFEVFMEMDEEVDSVTLRGRINRSVEVLCFWDRVESDNDLKARVLECLVTWVEVAATREDCVPREWVKRADIILPMAKVFLCDECWVRVFSAFMAFSEEAIWGEHVKRVFMEISGVLEVYEWRDVYVAIEKLQGFDMCGLFGGMLELEEVCVGSGGWKNLLGCVSAYWQSAPSEIQRFRLFMQGLRLDASKWEIWWATFEEKWQSVDISLNSGYAAALFLDVKREGLGFDEDKVGLLWERMIADGPKDLNWYLRVVDILSLSEGQIPDVKWNVLWDLYVKKSEEVLEQVRLGARRQRGDHSYVDSRSCGMIFEAIVMFAHRDMGTMRYQQMMEYVWGVLRGETTHARVKMEVSCALLERYEGLSDMQLGECFEIFLTGASDPHLRQIWGKEAMGFVELWIESMRTSENAFTFSGFV